MLHWKTLDMQKAFDLVAEHLANQTERCVDENGDCIYVQVDEETGEPTGNRCAAGALIAEDDLTILEWLEHQNNESVTSIGSAFEKEHHDVIEEQFGELLCALQSVHDTKSHRLASGRFYDWRAMRDVAGQFCLSDKVIDQYEGSTHAQPTSA